MVSKKKLEKFNQQQASHFREQVDKEVGRSRKRKSFIVISVLIAAVCFAWFVITSSYLNSTGRNDLLTGLAGSVFSIVDNPAVFKWQLIGPNTLKVFLVTFAVALVLILLLKFNDERHARDFPESAAGSARWQSKYKKFRKIYSDDDPNNDTLLAKDVRLTMNDRYSGLNNNVLCIGGAGTGKSRGLVKPNILQANSNLVITDPSGELLSSTARFLEEKKKYTIKVFNLIEFEKSNRYNPLKYVHSDTDVESLITCLITNTSVEGSHSEKFWEDAEKALLASLCYLLFHHFDEEYRNFSHIMKLLRWSKSDETGKRTSWLERIFLKPEKDFITDPNCAELREWFKNMYYIDERGNKVYNDTCKALDEIDISRTDIALKDFKIFHSAPAKTANGILISAGVRLASFNVPQIARLTDTDDINLDELSGIGEEYIRKKANGEKPEPLKQALYVIIPPADKTYNFLVSMMYSQLFDRMYRIGEKHCVERGMRLPVNIRFWLDEFANIGTIPEFTTRLSTMRKYGISCGIILQGVTQIQKLYEKDWGTIFANCNTFIFLGGQEQETMKYVSEQLGDQTIIKKSTSIQRSAKGGRGSGSYSYEKRPLLGPAEVARINRNQCIIIITGIDPFLTNKFVYEKHPNYKLTADYDHSLTYINTLDISGPTFDEITSLSREQEEEESKIRMRTLPALLDDHPGWIDYPRICARFFVLTASKESDSQNIDDMTENSNQDLDTEVRQNYLEEYPNGYNKSNSDFQDEDEEKTYSLSSSENEKDNNKNIVEDNTDKNNSNQNKSAIKKVVVNTGTFMNDDDED